MPLAYAALTYVALSLGYQGGAPELLESHFKVRTQHVHTASALRCV